MVGNLSFMPVPFSAISQMEPRENKTLSLNMNNKCLSLYSSSFLSCILMIFSYFVHFLMLRELEWQSAFVEFLFFFLFCLSLDPKPTHNIPPESPQNSAGSAFALLRTTLEWTAKPHRCVWKASIEAREGGKGAGFIQGLLPGWQPTSRPAYLPGCSGLWGHPNRLPATHAWYLESGRKKEVD